MKDRNIYGGASIGRQLTSSCEVDDPNSLRYCDLRELDIPYQTQFKLAGSYPLPYGIQISGNWQGYPGTVGGTARQDSVYDPAINRIPDASLNVNYNVTNTIIRAANPAATLTKFVVSKVRMQRQFDMFNVLNGSSILGTVETFGSTLDRPTAMLRGRLLAVGLQVNF